MDKLDAIAASEWAAVRVREWKRTAGLARAAVGYMPFPGHRTIAQIENMRRGAKHAYRRQYGYEGN